MSQFTDDLEVLCTETINKYGLQRLFLNFGHFGNEDRFYEYMNDMCDPDNIYVIYKYEIYYHGNVVTDDILRLDHSQGAVLPVLRKPISTVNKHWESIFDELDPKKRASSLLNVLTHKYALIDSDIYTPQFYSYVVFLCDSVILEDLTGRRHFSDYVNSTIKHYLIVGDEETLECFRLALKEFFDRHMSITL